MRRGMGDRIVSWAALAVSIVAMITGIGSCREAATANEALEEGRANNVYFEVFSAEPPRYRIVNRNNEPVLNVRFT